MRRDVLLQKSDSGEICLYDRRDNFHASFKNGTWVNDLVFQSYELEEFNLISDQKEIETVLAEARTALNCPLGKNKSDKAKSA
ncbi:MAG: hypothetical protein KC777_27090 [Cyanobacteria bacterium HKST-UBA02]|nr:hypothetical protein [Cyanobacteria bacterium HKST-UBA02]